MPQPPQPTDLPVPAPERNVGNTVRASWMFSLDDIRTNTAQYPKEASDALVAAFLWCIDDAHPIAKQDFAARVKVSNNLLYKIYTGKYRDPEGKQLCPSDELIRSIRSFLDLEKRRFESGTTEFVLTPTAQAIFNVCNNARESKTPAIMWGPSQIGKTWALRHYKNSNNHGRTFMAEFDAASGLGGMVRCIADACGISDRSNTASLIDRIKRALNQDTLLILDEVHLLKHTYRLNSFFACIETIRRIHDKTSCGMVLSWTEIRELKAASAGELVQLWRRGVHKVALPTMVTIQDLTAIFRATGLQFPSRDISYDFEVIKADGTDVVEKDKPREILLYLARYEGLKSITERLRYARTIAKKDGQRLGWFHFTKAHRLIAQQSVPVADWK